MVARATADVHKVKAWVGLGWWRRRATVAHGAIWRVLAFGENGSTLEYCAGEPGCTETRTRRAGSAL